MGTFSSIMASGHPIIRGVGFFSTKTIIANEANGDGSSMTWQRIETAVNNSSRHWPVQEVHQQYSRTRRCSNKEWTHTALCQCCTVWYSKIAQVKRSSFLLCISKSIAPLQDDDSMIYNGMLYIRIIGYIWYSFRASYPGVPGHIESYTAPYLSFPLGKRECCETNKFHLTYKRLTPDLIIEGRQRFPVRFSGEKYPWSSIFSSGISPASTLRFWISFPDPVIFLTQRRDSTWQILTSRSTGHVPLCFSHIFSYLSP